MLDRPTTDELTHHRIAAKTIRVVDILVAGLAREDRLPQACSQMVTAVLPGARIGEASGRHAGEAEGIIEFAMKQQTTVGTDGRAAEHELHGTVEFEPQRAGFRFTRRMRRQRLTP